MADTAINRLKRKVYCPLNNSSYAYCDKHCMHSLPSQEDYCHAEIDFGKRIYFIWSQVRIFHKRFSHPSPQKVSNLLNRVKLQQIHGLRVCPKYIF